MIERLFAINAVFSGFKSQIISKQGFLKLFFEYKIRLWKNV